MKGWYIAGSPDEGAGDSTNLFRNNVTVIPNMRLSGARTDGNQLVARLTNLYTGDEIERRVDQIVYDIGTRPRTGLYDDLRRRLRSAPSKSLRLSSFLSSPLSSVFGCSWHLCHRWLRSCRT